MKLSKTIAIGVAGGLGLAMSAEAINSDAQGNPYQSIVERNVFALRPPPPPPEASVSQAPPPPPIKLQGITSMFGRKQVLFSATVQGKPGEPPKQSGLVLAVGERQDDIEVLEIDEVAGIVKFNNHGTEEIKDLAKDSVTPAAAPVTPTVPGMPGITAPRPPQVHSAAMNNGGVTTIGAGTAGSTLRNIPIPSRTLRVPPTGAGARSNPLSPEEQIAHARIMEEKYRVEGNKGFTPPPPPSPPGLTGDSPPPVPQ